MKILLESLLVLVPFCTTITLWSFLFMAGMADRDETLRLTDGENWHPVADEDFDLHHQ
jgi:hypothetical protein